MRLKQTYAGKIGDTRLCDTIDAVIVGCTRGALGSGLESARCSSPYMMRRQTASRPSRRSAAA
jgi:hypothetical protein